MRKPGESVPSDLPAGPDDGPVAVDRGAFEAFDAWVSEQLAGLEAQWSHLAAPGAALPQRVVRSAESEGLAGAADSSEA